MRFSGVQGQLRKNAAGKQINCSFLFFLPSFTPPCYALDLKAIDNDAETIMDHDGEVQSFFNILTYKTAYSHIFLTTEENYDFIRYKLLFKNSQ